MTESSSTGEIIENPVVYNATNDAEGNIVFDTLQFDELSHVYYVIEEVEPKEPLQKFTYDDTRYLVEINVTNLKENGNVDLSKLVADTKITKLGSNEEVDAIVFSNDYTPNVVEVDTDEKGGMFKKVIKGRDWIPKDAFTFTIEAKNGAPFPDFPSFVLGNSDAKENDEVPFGFGKIKFTAKDMEDAPLVNGVRTKTFKYEVRENDYIVDAMSPQVPGQVATLEVTVTDYGNGRLKAESKVSNAIFTSIYTLKGAEIDTGSDTDGKGMFAAIVEGRDWKDTDIFTFTLTTADEGAPMPTNSTLTLKSDAKENDEVRFGFGKIEFTADHMEGVPTIAGIRIKQFTYHITGTYDIVGMEPEITSQTAILQVFVTDDGSGELKTEINLDNEIFKNKYRPVGTEIDTGTATDGNGIFDKVVKGRDWLDTDAFTFTLTGAKGTPMPKHPVAILQKDAKENDEVSFGFGKIEFDADDMIEATVNKDGSRTKIFTYKVKENDYTIDGMKPAVEDQVATLTVTVTDDGNGKLTAKWTVSNETFTNEYTPESTVIDTDKDTEGKGMFAKVVEGRDWLTSDDFTFTLTPKDGAPMPEKVEKIEKTITSDAKEDEAVQFGFGKLEFAAKDMENVSWKDGVREKTFTYEVRENGYDDIKGMSPKNPDQVATLTVTVTDDGSGKLQATPELINNKFVNIYTPESIVIDTDKDTEGNRTFTKAVTGSDWLTSDDFTFTLTGEKETPMPKQVTTILTSDAKENEEVPFGFGKIEFTADAMEGATWKDGVREKTFTYEVRENAYDDIAGMKPKDPDQVATLTVTVTDDGSGQLTAETTVSNATFVNEYTPESTVIDTDKDTEGNGMFAKVVEGRDWLTSDDFTFTLTPKDGAPMPEKVEKIEKTITSDAKEDEAVQFGFGKLEFTAKDMEDASWKDGVREKTFTYEVRENEITDIEGMTPQNPDQVATLTVTVTDDGSGKLQATPELINNKFVNIYTPGDAVVDTNEAGGLFAKVVEGRDWLASDDFTFTLTPKDGAPMPGDVEKIEKTITSDAKEDEAVQFGFGKLEFTAEDMKDVPFVAGIRVKVFTYEVKENKYDDIKGMSPKDPDQVAKLTVTVTDDGSGTLKTITNWDDTTFTNEYSPESIVIDTDKDTEGNRTFTKAVTGRDWLASDDFTFTLTPKDGAPMPGDVEKIEKTITSNAKEDEEVSFGFGKLEFTAKDMENVSWKDGVREKTFTYEVKENAYDDIAGMKPKDPDQVATLTVTVKDDGSGQLTAETTVSNAAFVNEYVPESIVIDTDKDTEGNGMFAKVVEGRDWLTSDDFTFTLTPKDGAPMPEKVEKLEKTVTSEEMEGVAVPFGFGKLEFTAKDMEDASWKDGVREKTFTYEVRENEITDIEGMTPQNPDQVATLTVTVTDDGKGKLDAEITELSSATFTNVYVPKGTKVDTGTAEEGNGIFGKVVEGRDWLDTDAFTFTLTGAKGIPMPKYATTTLTSDAKEDEEVSFGFGKIEFTADVMKDVPWKKGVRTKEFTYEVRENAYDIDGMTPKDLNQVTTLKVTVTDDGRGQLKADIENSNSIFTNIYVKPEVPTEDPDTGDTTNRTLWTTTLFISISGLGGLLYRRRKEKR